MARLMLLLLVVAPMILITYARTGQMGYKFKMTNGGKKFKEWIYVDVRKGLEMYKLQKASSGEDAGEIIYDCKKNLTMIGLPKAKSCFLRTLTGCVSQPAALQKALKLAKKSAKIKVTSKSVEKWKVVYKLKDRSALSKEMADLCSKWPIYRVTEDDLNQDDMDQMDETDKGSDMAEETAKRGCTTVVENICNDEYYRTCNWWGCKTHKRQVCRQIITTSC